MAVILTANERILIAAAGKIRVFDKKGTFLSVQSCGTETSTLCACVSPDGERVAVGTGNKSVIVYEFCPEPDTNGFTLVATIPLKKAPTCISFVDGFGGLLVCDRAGYLSQHAVQHTVKDDQATKDNQSSKGDQASEDKQANQSEDSPVTGKLLLGHMSMLLHMGLNRELGLVATCDRDEKIRISKYPKTYCIHNYCLGHTQYVKCCSFVKYKEHTFLVSGGGDGTVRFWNIENGKLLGTVDLTENQLDNSYESYDHVAPTTVNQIVCPGAGQHAHEGAVLVSCHNPEKLNLLRFEYDSERQMLSVTLKSMVDCSELNWQQNAHFWSMCVDSLCGSVYVLVSSSQMQQVATEEGDMGTQTTDSDGAQSDNEQSEQQHKQKFAILKIVAGREMLSLTALELDEQTCADLSQAKNELPLSAKNVNFGSLEKYKEMKKLRTLKKRKIEQITGEV